MYYKGTCSLSPNTTTKTYRILDFFFSELSTAIKACSVHSLNLRFNTTIKAYSVCFLNSATFYC